MQRKTSLSEIKLFFKMFSTDTKGPSYQHRKVVNWY